MIKVLSLFSGIGAFERACCRIGLDWELVNYCEIDRWASLSYSMVNQCSELLNLRDVRTVTAETVRDQHVDLITYGFPCQDISIAGKQQGFVNDSGESTRSGLAPTLNTVGGGNLEPKITIDGTIGPHETDRITGKDGMVQTLKATDYKNPPKIVIDGLTRDTQKQKARVFNPSGLAASLIATDYKEPPQISVIGQLKGGEKGRVVDRDGIGYTLTATEYKDPLKIAEPEHAYGVRIRKLTPRECWRLMGFLDEEFDRVHGISNSQLYKQAGNSIVVNVLSALLSQLFYKEFI